MGRRLRARGLIHTPLRILAAWPTRSPSPAGAPSLDIVDVEGLREAAQLAFENDPAGTTAYGTSVGYVPLREWIAEQHGVDGRAGARHQRLDAGRRVPVRAARAGRATRSIVESPTYDRTLLNLRNRGADVRMVELETDGIDVDALETLLARRRVRPKLAHIIPNFQNPAGYTLSAREARRRCCELAAEHDFTIFEDDPYIVDPLRGRGAADDALAGRGGPGRLRVVVLQDRLPGHPRRLPGRPAGGDQADPDASRPTPTSRRTWSPSRSSTSSPLGADGRRDRDGQERAARAPRRARRRAGARAPRGAVRRRRRAATSCGSSCPRRSTSPSSRGRGQERGVLFVKGTDFLLEGGENTLRLAYSGVTPEQIDEGITRLAEAVAVARRPPSGIRYGDDPLAVRRAVPRDGDGPSVAVLIHGGFWRGALRPQADARAVRRPRRARLGGVEHRVPAARRSGGGCPATLEDVRAGDRPPRRRCDGRSTSRASWRSATPPAATWRRGRRRASDPRVPLTGVGRPRPACSTCARACELRLSDGVVQQLPRRRPTSARALRRRLADRAAAARRARAARRTAALDDIVPVEISERFARAPRRDAASSSPSEDHFGPPRPGEPAVAGGGRVAADAATTPTRARRRRPARGVPRALRDRRPRARSTSTATRSAACPGHARPRSRAVVDQWGERARRRLARLDRRARRAPATCSPTRARRARPARCWSATRPRSTSTSSCSAALDADAAPRALVTDRDNFPTDRYVLEGLAARSAASSCGFESTTRSSRRAACDGAGALVVLSHVAYRSGALADMRADRRRARTARTSSGTSRHSAGAVPVDLARPASSSPSAAPTSTSTPGRARPRTCTSRERAAGAAALADLGLVRPARPVRDGARLRPGAGHRALPRRHAADPRRSPRSRRACG